MAPAGAGTPTKKLAGPDRPIRIVDHHIEAGEPQAGANGESHRGDPAGRFQIVQAPEVEDQRRGYAEIDEIRQAVELGAKARGSFQEPRQAAVDAIKNGGEHDSRERKRIAVLERHANGGEPGAKREQSDEVRRQRAHGDAAETAAAAGA